MSELFSGICGGIIVFILTVIWDVWKNKHDAIQYQIKLKNELYIKIFEMFQIPVKKMNVDSQEYISWYLTMEKLHLQLTVLGEEDFITEYLQHSSEKHNPEELKFMRVNKLRRFYGNENISREQYNQILGN